MDNERRYLNNALCYGMSLFTSKAGNTCLRLEFLGVTGKNDDYSPKTEQHTLVRAFTDARSASNIAGILNTLGFDCGSEVTPAMIRKGLKGKADRSVDLVLTPDDQNPGQERVAFVNEAKFGTRVFDNTK